MVLNVLKSIDIEIYQEIIKLIIWVNNYPWDQNKPKYLLKTSLHDLDNLIHTLIDINQEDLEENVKESLSDLDLLADMSYTWKKKTRKKKKTQKEVIKDSKSDIEDIFYVDEGEENDDDDDLLDEDI